MDNRYYNIVLNKDVNKFIYGTLHTFPKGYIIHTKILLEQVVKHLCDLRVTLEHHEEFLEEPIEFDIADTTVEFYIGEDYKDRIKVECPHNCPRFSRDKVFPDHKTIIEELADKHSMPYDDMFNRWTLSVLIKELNGVILSRNSRDEYYTWSPSYKEDLELMSSEVARKKNGK